jgi:hypothetical protein
MGSNISWADNDINIVFELPAHWKLGNKVTNQNFILLEYIPEQNTIDSSDELITYKSIKADKLDPMKFFNREEINYRKLCPFVQISSPIIRDLKGYKILEYSYWCPGVNKDGEIDQGEFSRVFNAFSDYGVYIIFNTLKPTKDYYVLPEDVSEWFHLPEEKKAEWDRFIKNTRICNNSVNNFEQSCVPVL